MAVQKRSSCKKCDDKADIKLFIRHNIPDTGDRSYEYLLCCQHARELHSFFRHVDFATVSEIRCARGYIEIDMTKMVKSYLENCMVEFLERSEHENQS